MPTRKTKTAAKKSAKKVKRPARKTSRKRAKKAAKRPARKPARKTAKKARKTASKRPGKTPSKKAQKTASKKVAAATHEMKAGRLKSGRSNKKVKSRKQAIAIGLSQARKSGANIPENPNK